MLVFSIDGEKRVYIVEGGLLMARLKASLAGYSHGFVEGHELDDKMAGKVPKSAVRKLLTTARAQRVLAKLG